ncbi:MAG: hypothetical protein GX896_01845 [Clostridiales bacterium]|nr:hypothetical protein [Clostridiales bacterium]
MDIILSIIEIIADAFIAKPQKLLDRYIRPDKKNKLIMNVLSVLFVYTAILLTVVLIYFISTFIKK